MTFLKYIMLFYIWLVLLFFLSYKEWSLCIWLRNNHWQVFIISEESIIWIIICYLFTRFLVCLNLLKVKHFLPYPGSPLISSNNFNDVASNARRCIDDNGRGICRHSFELDGTLHGGVRLSLELRLMRVLLLEGPLWQLTSTKSLYCHFLLDLYFSSVRVTIEYAERITCWHYLYYNYWIIWKYSHQH